MITDVATQINQLDISKTTKANALALLLAVHPENGHAVIAWSDLATMFGGVDQRVARRHLGAMQKADLIHYSSNGDGLVYVNFKAWLSEKRALSARNSCIEDTKNVHSEHEKRALSTLPETYETDDARVGARKTCTESTKNARGRALTYTHASARIDGLTDPLSMQVTSQSVPPSPEAQAKAFALLRAIKVTHAEAATLAAAHPFERIERCVAAWWMNREEHGGKLQSHNPGAVVYWLKEWPRMEPNPYDERAWTREDLYRTYVMVAEELAPTPPPLPVVVEAQPPPATGYLDADPGWLAVAADPHAAAELAGLVGIGSVDNVPLYRLAAKDPEKIRWLNERMATRLRRLIASAVGRPVIVEIIGATDG